jgi:hypothetical protein
MNSRAISIPVPFPVLLVLAASFVLSACSEDKTVVALNLISDHTVDEVSKVEVSIQQSGQGAFTASFVPDHKTVDAGVDEDGTEHTAKQLVSPLVKRFELPDSWEEKPADVNVTVSEVDGDVWPGKVTVNIQKAGATAALVHIATVVPAPAPAPATGGQGGCTTDCGGAGGETSEGGGGEGGAG